MSMSAPSKPDLSEFRAVVEYGGPNSVADYVTRLLQERQEAEDALARVTAEREDYRERKDAAYEERNQVVAALSKLWPSHWCWHPEADKEWDPEWRTIICIHSPMGQLTWHIHLSQHALFAHLPKGENHWDGHDTPEKYRRLAALEPADRLTQLGEPEQDKASAPQG